MMFMAIDSAGWVAIIAAISAAVGSFFTMWKTLQTNKKVDEVKAVAVESLKLANGNMGTALQTNVISAQALVAQKETPANLEKLAAAEKQLAAHQAIKHKSVNEVAPDQQA